MSKIKRAAIWVKNAVRCIPAETVIYVIGLALVTAGVAAWSPSGAAIILGCLLIKDVTKETPPTPRK